MLGAYYAAELFCRQAGIEMIPLEDYDDYAYYSDDEVALDQEYVPYYLLPEGTNWQTVTVRESTDNYSTHESPAIALSRRGLDIFIAGSFSQSILHGDGNNGKSLLIMGDNYAEVFAPWLTPYYDSVVFVSMSRYQGDHAAFRALFAQYNITDCIFMENIFNWGDSIENNRFSRYLI